MGLFAGVAGACVLGAGLGLWARPSDLERPEAPAAAAALAAPVATNRRIPIVIDDSPAPLGAPLDVLSPSQARPAVIPPAPAPGPSPELVAPSRAPSGLVRVDAPAPGPLAPASTRPVLPIAAAPERQAAARPAVEPRPVHAKLDAERLQAAKRAKAERRAIAEARTERLAAAKLRREKARAAEAALAEAAAQPEPRRRHGLAVLAHAIAKLAPHHPRPAPEPEARAEAQPAPRHRPSHPTRLAKAEPKPSAARPKAPVPQLASRAAHPVAVANASNARCASQDAGEALACGDPKLGAAERRMARAYRDAEAAGVPASTLAHQQQRWRAARATAAREAPWAVREIYQARIAELQDLARDAKGE